MKIGIIGYGSMGRMLLRKFARLDALPYGSLLVSNRTPEKLEEAKDIAVICSNVTLASESDIIFVCVRPADMKSVLKEISTSVKDDVLLVTLNGSITFEMISKIINCRTAKVIPSVTAEIDRSQTLVCYNSLAREDDKKNLYDLLSSFGEVIELPENEIGMGSELVSCMPGFIASIFDVICTSAEAHTSIPHDQIVKMVLNTLSATGDLMLADGLSFDDVVARVATKGGITEEGTKIIYGSFPPVAEEMFQKTLEKRKLTAEKAGSAFSED